MTARHSPPVHSRIRANGPRNLHHAKGRGPDITYIPLQKGILYLVAIVDLISRNVLSWKLSKSLDGDTQFCLNALEMVLEGGRKPKIFH